MPPSGESTMPELMNKIMANDSTDSEQELTRDPEWVNHFTQPSISLVIAVGILVSSAPPAATIWRSAHLHKPSYYYVMIMCLTDCAIGSCTMAYSISNLLLLAYTGGISVFMCSIFEMLATGLMNAINLLMFLLSKDRCLSVLKPLQYRTLVSDRTVWCHAKMVALYGLIQGSIFITARLYNGDPFRRNFNCRADTWILLPEIRLGAITSVLANLVMDMGTAFYNIKVLHCAWKIKQIEIVDASQLNPLHEAQRRRQLKIFIFTFKLVSLFLLFSMPYKILVLMGGAGGVLPQRLLHAFGFLRMSFHIVDGWVFSSNDELLEAMKAMMINCFGE